VTHDHGHDRARVVGGRLAQNFANTVRFKLLLSSSTKFKLAPGAYARKNENYEQLSLVYAWVAWVGLLILHAPGSPDELRVELPDRKIRINEAVPFTINALDAYGQLTSFFQDASMSSSDATVAVSAAVADTQAAVTVAIANPSPTVRTFDYVPSEGGQFGNNEWRRSIDRGVAQCTLCVQLRRMPDGDPPQRQWKRPVEVQFHADAGGRRLSCTTKLQLQPPAVDSVRLLHAAPQSSEVPPLRSTAAVLSGFNKSEIPVFQLQLSSSVDDVQVDVEAPSTGMLLLLVSADRSMRFSQTMSHLPSAARSTLRHVRLLHASVRVGDPMPAAVAVLDKDGTASFSRVFAERSQSATPTRHLAHVHLVPSNPKPKTTLAPSSKTCIASITVHLKPSMQPQAVVFVDARTKKVVRVRTPAGVPVQVFARVA